jgi:tripartite-type tricarboxylate transporter receptor subunit TctC
MIALGCIAAFAEMAAAQSYPTRPVRLIVPFAPGGAADAVARIVAAPLGERLGKNVLVDNRPGGGATIGADVVAKSQPDGYTLLYGTPGPQIINPFLMKKVPYEPLTDFAPISRIAIIPSVLVVPASVPVRSVKDLIALAKAQPNRINFASAGIGASSHLGGELFKTMAGIDIVHVPYKGTGPALQDLLAGNVQMAIDSLSVYVPHIKAGTLRALGMATAERSPLFPDLPTIGETLKGFEASPMNYVATRAGVPRAIVDRLNTEINAVLKTPEVRDRLLGLGINAAGSTPQALDAEIRREQTKWKKVIEISGARAE